MYGSCEPGAYEIECFDSDLDGVSNSFDLDDDNDGILDRVESSGNEPDLDHDGDGIVNWMDTFDDGGTGDGSVTDYSDTDMNGVPDVYDSDGRAGPNHIAANSDGDTCGDAIEAGFMDGDDDGTLGDSPVTTDGDGLVVGQGGYLAPLDRDNNGILDFLEITTSSSLVVQPADIEQFGHTDAVFSATVSDADTFRWQFSEDGGADFVDIADGAQYSGSRTSELTVTRPGPQLNDRVYRLLSLDSSYACDMPSISDSVRLTVRVGRV